MIETILFDLDGVLVDATEIHYNALNNALEEVAGFRISRSDHIEIYNGLPTKTKLNKLVDLERITHEQIEAIYGLKQKYTMQQIKSLLTYDREKVLMLKMLKEDGYQVGCVTNAIGQTAIEMLTRTGQLEYMDVFINNQDVIHCKPNPAPYLMAMSVLGVSPKKTLIVEDSEKGFMSATSANAHVMKVDGPHEVTYENIRKLIKGINETG